MWLEPHIHQQGEGVVHIKLCSSACRCLPEDACQRQHEAPEHHHFSLFVAHTFVRPFLVFVVSLRNNGSSPAACRPWSPSPLVTLPNSLAFPGACRSTSFPFILSSPPLQSYVTPPTACAPSTCLPVSSNSPSLTWRRCGG